MTRPKPNAPAARAPSAPRIHPGCLIAAVIDSPPLCPARIEGHRVRLSVLRDRLRQWRRDLGFQAPDPFAEFGGRLDHDRGPHRSVAEAAKLGADQLVGPD